MAKYSEDRAKRTPLTNVKPGTIDIFQRQDGRLGAVDRNGNYLGIDKRVQAKAIEISRLEGKAKAEAVAELRNSCDMAFLCQVDDNGNPAQVVTASGEVRTAEYGWCLVLHTTPQNVLLTL